MEGQWLLLVVGAVVASLVLAWRFASPRLTRWYRTGDGRWELVRAILVLLVWIVAFGLVIASILGPWPAWEPLRRFLLVLAVVVVALLLSATEWGRRTFVLGSLVMFVGLAGTLVRIGWDHEPRAQLAAAIREHRELKAAAEDRDAELDEAATSSRADLLDKVGQAREPLRSSAQAIHDALAANQADIVSAELTNFLAAYEPGRNELDDALRAAVQQAIDTAAAATTYEPPTDDTLVAALTAECAMRQPPAVAGCSEIAGTGDDSGPTTPTVRGTSVATGSAAPVAVELATYRFAVTGDEDDEASMKQAQADQRTPRSRTVVDSIGNAPAGLFDGDAGGATVPVPGPVGWALIGGAALALWTWQMRRNAHQLAGPVEFGDKQVRDELRIALLQNLPEPSVIPGGGGLTSVTTLVELAGGPGGKIIGKLVELIAGVIGASFGYVVETDHVPVKDTEGTTDKTTHQVLVRFRDRVNKRTVDVAVVEDPEEAGAYTAAGFWAAGKMLERSSRIPSWARWSPRTARAVTATMGPAPTLAELEAASRDAPDSGLILHLLGSKYELAGKPIQALDSYLRAVEAHPRFMTAYYRLAGNLSMLANDVKPWTDLVPQEPRSARPRDRASRPAHRRRAVGRTPCRDRRRRGGAASHTGRRAHGGDVPGRVRAEPAHGPVAPNHLAGTDRTFAAPVRAGRDPARVGPEPAGSRHGRVGLVDRARPPCRANSHRIEMRPEASRRAGGTPRFVVPAQLQRRLPGVGAGRSPPSPRPAPPVSHPAGRRGPVASLARGRPRP